LTLVELKQPADEEKAERKEKMIQLLKYYAQRVDEGDFDGLMIIGVRDRYDFVFGRSTGDLSANELIGHLESAKLDIYFDGME
jgi:hypothetical protein